MKYLKYLVVSIVMFFPLYVQGLEATTKMNCNKSLLSLNESTTCTIEVNVQSGGIKSFQGTIEVSSKLEVGNISVSDIWINNSTSQKISVQSDTSQTDTVTIGSFVVTAKSVDPNTSESIKLKEIVLTDELDSSVNFDDISKSIRIPSNNASLKTLEVSEGTLSPAFDSNVINYELTNVTSDKINIDVTGYDNASIEVTGNKNLQYGKNEIKITVKAESGITKTYTIKVNRVDNRSNDTSLKNLTVKDGVINNKNEVIFPSNIDTFTVTAAPNHEKATVKYSDNNVKLGLDETYTIYVYVTAENGQKATYSVTATRKDDRSSNNYLKSLKVNDEDISLSTLQSYTITVKNDVTVAEIEAIAEDGKAKIAVSGSKNLKVGSNKFNIVVTAENEAIRTYTLIVIRKDSQGDITDLSNNTYLKTLKIKNIDLEFTKEQLEYNLEVESDVSSIEVSYEAEDSKATVGINGSTELKFGLNVIHITVTAENGETSDYVLNVTRKEKNYEVKNDEKTIIAALNNKNDYEEVKVNVSSQDGYIIPKKIIEALINSKKRITYQVLEGDQIKYSLILDGKLLNTYDKDFNYQLVFKDATSEISNIIGDKKNIVLEFQQADELPLGVVYKVYVGDTFNSTSFLHLFSYENGVTELNLEQENISVTDGYVIIPFERIYTYVLLNSVPGNIEEEPNIKENNNMISTYIIAGAAGIGIMVLIAIIIIISKKKKGNKKKDNKQINNTENMSIEPEVINVSPVTDIKVVEPVTEDTAVIDIIDIDDNTVNNTELLFGISVMDIEDYLEKCPLADLKNSGISEGIVIISFENNSPLQISGLNGGDLLVGINGQKIVNKEQFKTLVSNIVRGQEVEFTYYRNGQNKNVKILIP